LKLTARGEVAGFQESQVSSPDENGNTLLINAAAAGNLNVVQVLLDHGADSNAQNNTNHTALYLVRYRLYSYFHPRESTNKTAL
jgi:hypothetical protein